MTDVSDSVHRIFVIARTTRRTLDHFFHLDNQPEVIHTYDRDIAFQLYEELLKNGFQSSCVCGYYLDCDPDIFEYTEAQSDDPTARKHWWVVVDNQTIVDITADQFYRSYRREDYDVVITDITNKRYSKPRT